MRDATIQSIKMLAQADPEATPEIIEAVVNACTATGAKQRRELIDSATARAIIGISKVTLSHWVKAGRITPVKISKRIYKYDKAQIEALAFGQ